LFQSVLLSAMAFRTGNRPDQMFRFPAPWIREFEFNVNLRSAIEHLQFLLKF